MVLVDTSVWIRHLREGDPQLTFLLVEGEVAVHPWVIGELACGHLEPRDEILSLLHALPVTAVLATDEYYRFLDTHLLAGRGLGFVDVHILGAACLAQVPLWSHDRALRRAALGMELSFRP